MVDPSLLFKAPSLIKAASELAGIVESTGAKVDRMLHAPLGAGVHALRDAAAAIAPSEREKLIDEATSCFRRAVQHEKGLGQMQAFLGLFVCYSEKSELPLALNALDDASKVRTPRERLETPRGAREISAKLARTAAHATTLSAAGLLVRVVLRRSVESIEDEVLTAAEIRDSAIMEATRAAIRDHRTRMSIEPNSAAAASRLTRTTKPAQPT